MDANLDELQKQSPLPQSVNQSAILRQLL